MKTIGVRQVSKKWSELLEQNAGAEVAITNRGQVVAYLRVPKRKKAQTGAFPDFKKRIQARFGDRILTNADVSWLDEATKSAF